MRAGEGMQIAAGMIGLAEASMVRGHAGQSFRLACPCGQETEGLKTLGY